MSHTLESTIQPRTAPAAAAPLREHNLPMGYLRAFVTALVVAHHGSLAYHPYAPPLAASITAKPYWWGAFPVIDSQRSQGLALLTGFNDTFFMALMFFLSGLFVWNSLERKGSKTFLTDRLVRLGIPFAIGSAVLAPIAYYPAFLQMGGHSVAEFARQWLSLDGWMSGPVWFVWVLLAFDAIAAGLYLWKSQRESWARWIPRGPFAFFALLAVISGALYVGLSLQFSPLMWSTFGPFTFQTSRILYYLTYFLVGVAVGAQGISEGILMRGGKLARRWPLWGSAAALIFTLDVGLAIFVITTYPQSIGWQTLANTFFALSSAATSLAFLSVFTRFAQGRNSVFDSMSRNAYGIYLLHYTFVNWLQFALLGAPLPALAKATIVILGGLALAWMSTAALRRIPAVARII